MRHLVLWCMLLSILTGFVTADLTTNLVGYWPMEEGSGMSLADVTPFGNNGTVVTGASSPLWSDGLRGPCLRLDGVDDHVVVDNQDFFNFYDHLSIGVWVKGSFIRRWQAFVSKGGEASGWQIRRYDDSDNAGFTIRGLSPLEDYQGVSVITDGQWHLVVATYDGSALCIYVDGQKDIEYSVDGAPKPSEEPVIFGAAKFSFGDFPLDNFHYGLLDEIAIWHRALSVRDVNDLYNNGVPKDLINWRWKATNPVPADGASGVAFETPVNLQWTAGLGSPDPITQYILFYGTDKINVASSRPDLPQGDTVTVTLDAAETTYPITVVSDTTYYWRVASVIGNNCNDPNFVAPGSTWAFVTAQAKPSFTKQPGLNFADAGQSVNFAVETKNADTYQWYRTDMTDSIALSDNAKYSGTTTDTLTISDVQSDDEAYFYYCVIANTVGQTQSDNGGLRIKKMLAHWPLDGSAREATYSSLDGIVIGDIDWVSSPPFETVASFDTGEYIVIPSDSNDISFDVYDALTVSCFVRNPVSNNWESFVSKNGESDEGWILRQHSSSGTGVFTLRGTTGYDDPPGVTVIDDGQWHHIVGVYNTYAGKRVLYVDGKLDNEIKDTGLITPTLEPIMIGRTPAVWANYFSGEMAHVQIYNYPMTDMEIADLNYQLRREPFCKQAPRSDLTGDCQVNLDDLAVLITEWLVCGMYPDCP